MSDLHEQAIRQHCKTLRMPTIGAQFARLAEAAVREQQSHVGYLEALLATEMEERDSRAIARLLNEARLPRMKTLDGFEFDRSGVSAAKIHGHSQARGTAGQGSIALDGKTLRGSFDHFHDRAAAQVLSAFAADTALLLAHVDIDARAGVFAT